MPDRRLGLAPAVEDEIRRHGEETYPHGPEIRPLDKFGGKLGVTGQPQVIHSESSYPGCLNS